MSLTRVRLSEAWNWGGLSTRELALRTYKAMEQHETLDRAAVLAFYALQSLVPLLGITLVIALGARKDVAGEVADLSAGLLPSEAQVLISRQIHQMQQAPAVGLLSISTLVLLWSASSLFTAVMDATNASYAVRDQRPWWKRRAMALVLTLVEAILLMGSAAAIVAWPAVTAWLGLSALGAALATVVQWLVVIVALLAGFAIAYYFGPHAEQRWEWITPGATLGVLVLIAASVGLRLYLQYGTSSSATYGTLAGVVVLLLWLYIAGLALLVGAEVNSVIEHAAPHGKAPGQKEDPLEKQARQSGAAQAAAR
jgi:membrane protein